MAQVDRKVLRTASAGTVESSDAMITITSNEGGGIVVDITSPVKAQFGDDMVKSINEICIELGVKDAKVSVQDKGALDYALRARTEAALLRASKNQ